MIDLTQRKNQSARILRLLIQARGAWVPLPEILALGIAQYSARIFELRRMNFFIENKVETMDDGTRHSWFRLLPNDAQPQPQEPPSWSPRSPRSPRSSPRPPSPAPEPPTPSPPQPDSDSRDWYERTTNKKRPAVAHETLFLWERE